MIVIKGRDAMIRPSMRERTSSMKFTRGISANLLRSLDVTAVEIEMPISSSLTVTIAGSIRRTVRYYLSNY